MPLVSVVIPTTLRPELGRAIASVRNQMDVDVEVVVVVDSIAEPAPLNDVDVQVWTGGNAGGARSRNLGVDNCNGDFIAFLDDDDEWVSNKCAKQLSLLRRVVGPAIVSTRVLQVSARSGSVGAAIPNQLIRATDRVEDYLFRRRRPTPGRASLFTSTLLCEGSIARAVRWDESLPRHQDWDWLYRAQQAHDDLVFLQTEEPLVMIQVGSGDSISSSSDWSSSLSWAQSVASRWAATTRADFLMAQTMRYALQARSLRGLASTFRAIRETRRVPSGQAILSGMAGIISRKRLNSLLTSKRRHSAR